MDTPNPAAPTPPPEPLAAILAEMRDYADRRAADAGGERPAVELLRSYAARIEVAAKNTENAFGMALAIEDGLHKRDKQSSPGNAAAIREALEQALAYCESDQRSGIAYSDNDVLVPMLRAALAAPARNCDRFATAEDQAKRQSRFCMSQAGRCTTCPADRPTHNACVLAWAQMPFTTAEGGAE